MKLRFLLILASSYLAACSTAYFAVPNQRFDSPTVAGGLWKGNAGGGYTHPTYVVTVNNTNASPPSSSGGDITRDPQNLDFADGVVVDLHLGLDEKFEVSKTGDLFHIKYQFMGSSRIEHKSDEFVGSVMADYLKIDRDNDSDQYSSSDSSVIGDGFGASVIVGYHGAGPWIYYLNLNYLDFSAKTEVHQHPGDFSYDGDGTQIGTVAGIRYEEASGLYMAGEWAYSDTKWSGVKRSQLGSVGGVLGWAW